MLLLEAGNVHASSGTRWFILPLIGLGFAVAMYAARVFPLSEDCAIANPPTEPEPRQSGADKRDEGP